jgi:hypothetical protein
VKDVDAQENWPELAALTSFLRWSCRESNPLLYQGFWRLNRDSLRLVPVRSRSLPAVSLSSLDGVKSLLTRAGACRMSNQKNCLVRGRRRIAGSHERRRAFCLVLMPSAVVTSPSISAPMSVKIAPKLRLRGETLSVQAGHEVGLAEASDWDAGVPGARRFTLLRCSTPPGCSVAPSHTPAPPNASVRPWSERQ